MSDNESVDKARAAVIAAQYAECFTQPIHYCTDVSTALRGLVAALEERIESLTTTNAALREACEAARDYLIDMYQSSRSNSVQNHALLITKLQSVLKERT